jgi:uncharacterized protein (TIGR03067 family)
MAILMVSYAIFEVRHRWALGELKAAMGHAARSDWSAAVGCLDRAKRDDPFLAEAYLQRARVIHQYLHSDGILNLDLGRDDPLTDMNWYVWFRPKSGEGHYQRGLALMAFRRHESAHREFDQAIPLLDDPTLAMAEKAEVSFLDGDRAAALNEINAAIERYPLVPEYYAARSRYRRFFDLASMHAYGISFDAIHKLQKSYDPAGRHSAYADRARAAVLRQSRVESVERLEVRVNALLDEHPIAIRQDTPTNAADRARLLGTWKVVAQQYQDQSRDMTDRELNFMFEANRYQTVNNDWVRLSGSCSLDAERPLHRMDWSATIQGKPYTLLGIYKFRGDDLLISMADPGDARPTTFTPDAYDPVVHYTLRRTGQDRGGSTSRRSP